MDEVLERFHRETGGKRPVKRDGTPYTKADHDAALSGFNRKTNPDLFLMQTRSGRTPMQSSGAPQPKPQRKPFQLRHPEHWDLDAQDE